MIKTLARWSEKRKGMARNVEREPTRREAKKVIAAANNHYKGKAVVNAIDLKRLLGIKNNPIPEELVKSYPRLERGNAELGNLARDGSRHSSGKRRERRSEIG